MIRRIVNQNKFAKPDFFITITALIWLTVSLFTPFGVFNNLNLWMLDNVASNFEVSNVADDVVVVAIDTPSFQDAELNWPWPRSRYAEFLESAGNAGAKAVVFDIVFDQVTEDDIEFSAAIEKFGTVILAAEKSIIQTPQGLIETLSTPVSVLASAASAVGSASLPMDEDSRIRRMPSYTDLDRSSLIGASAFVLGALPSHERTENYIRYSKAPNQVPIVSFYQALTPNTFLPEGAFQDKVLVVGLSMAANPAALSFVGDEVLIPDYASNGQGFHSSRVPGVIVQAEALQTALSNNALKRSSLGLEIGLALVAFALSFVAALIVKTDLRKGLICFMGTLLFLILSLCMARSMGVVLIIGPAVVGVFSAGLFQTTYGGLKSFLERRKLVANFGKYVAPEILKTILDSERPPSLGGELRPVSIIVTDLAGYTALMESLSPERGAQVLREYLDALGKVVLEHGGMIDQFIGDSIIAIFNAPLDQADHAKLSIDCIDDLQKVSEVYRRECHANGIELGRTRIGAHCGLAVVGNFGSQDRFHYTAMGDVVNVAARLEAANKIVGSQVLVSKDLYQAAKSSRPFLPLGDMNLYGKSETISIYTLASDVSSKDIDEYLAAFDLLCAGDAGALDRFKALHETYNDNDALNYINAVLLKGEVQKPKVIIGK